MAKRTQLSTKDHPSQSKRQCNFDTTDENFEEFTCGFVLENTLADTQKCVRFLGRRRRPYIVFSFRF